MKHAGILGVIFCREIRRKTVLHNQNVWRNHVKNRNGGNEYEKKYA